jgi:excinuclease ABC subunit C
MIAKPSDIPKNPGVYKWRDSAGRVIYVGKAKNLRSRLNSYFVPVDKLHQRTHQMVQAAHSLEWTVVHNEIEALTLEYAWIKEFEPRFNVIFRNDDKSYPYLAITSVSDSTTSNSADQFARVHITRKKSANSVRRRTKYYGPYPQTWAIRTIFPILQEVFGVRNCTSAAFQSASRTKRPCLLGYINRCSAPCIGKISAEDYANNVNNLKQFLRGQSTYLINKLRTDMQNAASALDYEIAAKRRDQLQAIQVVIEKNSAELATSETLDVLGIDGDELEAGVHVFHIERGIIVGEQVWIAAIGADQSTEQVLEDVLAKLYLNGDNSIPPEIVVPYLPANYTTITNLLKGLRGANVHLHIGQRGAKRSLSDKATQNARNSLERARKNRVTDLLSRNLAASEIQQALNLANPPLRIECYDISHMSGEFQVGAMVVFEDGMPKKKDYRLFNLQGKFIQWNCKSVPDDTAAIYEVIRRRLEHFTDQFEMPTDQNASETTSNELDELETVKQHFAYNPELLLIDGGQPQVNAAWRAVQDANLTNKLQVAGIAKRLEEIWLPNSQYPVILKRNSLGVYLLQQLRDEAHRFSITAMRKRRSKSYTKSKLDNIKGLGVQKQKRLLKQFGSIKRIIAASSEELQQVDGITDAIIAQLKELSQ